MEREAAFLAGAGLCGRCRHAEIVRSARGSLFLRCGRARTDPAFPKYPPLPVRACAGYEPPLGAGGAEPSA